MSKPNIQNIPIRTPEVAAIKKAFLAGSSWDNPVWYREKWRIYTNSYIPGEFAAIAYVHDDYDVDDNRCGYAASIEAAKLEIDERFY